MTCLIQPVAITNSDQFFVSLKVSPNWWLIDKERENHPKEVQIQHKTARELGELELLEFLPVHLGT